MNGVAVEDRRSTSWDVRAAPRNYFALVGAQTITFATAFALMALLTRKLGPSGYGTVIALVAAGMLTMQFTLNATAIAFYRLGAEEYLASGRLSGWFWNRAMVAAVTVGIMLGLCKIWVPFVLHRFQLSLRFGYLLLGYFLAQALWTHAQQGLLAAKLPRHQAWLTTCERLLSLSAVGVVVALNAATPELVVSIYVVSSLIVSAAGFFFLRSLIGSVRVIELGAIGQLLRYALPLFPAAVVSYLSTTYLDTLLLLDYKSLADAGRYAAAAQVAGAFTQLPLLAGTLVLPALLGRLATDRGAAGRFLHYVLPSLAIAWSLMCLLTAIVSPSILGALLGARFNGTGKLLQIMLAVAAISGPCLMGLIPIAHALSAPRIIAANAFTTAILNVVLDVVLIPRYGIEGCAWASVLAAVCSFAVTLWWVSHAATEPTSLATAVVVSPSLLLAVLVTFGSAWLADVAALAVWGLVFFLCRPRVEQALRWLREQAASPLAATAGATG